MFKLVKIVINVILIKFYYLSQNYNQEIFHLQNNQNKIEYSNDKINQNNNNNPILFEPQFSDNIQSGNLHNCHIDLFTKYLTCWGDNTYGQTTLPFENTKSTKVTSASAGNLHSCAVDNGDIHCWGGNPHGQTDFDSALNQNMAALVQAGHSHSCMLNTHGLAKCWGSEEWKQTDVIGRIENEQLMLSLGFRHTCGIKESSRLICWGDNELGQTDIPDQYNVGVIQVASGEAHNCYIIDFVKILNYVIRKKKFGDKNKDYTKRTHQQLFSKMYSRVQMKKDGKQEKDSTDFRQKKQMDMIPEEDTFELPKNEGPNNRLMCFGHNLQSQSQTPDEITLQEIVSVRAGQAHSCALSSKGLLQCWGYKGVGQTHVPFEFLSSTTALSNGQSHNCGINRKGLIKCWGNCTNARCNVPDTLNKL